MKQNKNDGTERIEYHVRVEIHLFEGQVYLSERLNTRSDDTTDTPEIRADAILRLKDNLVIAELTKKINDLKEIEAEFQRSQKNKILIGLATVGAFILVSLLFFIILSGRIVYSTVSATISVIAGSFIALLVMSISGLFKEFTFKGGIIEVTTKLQEKIETVQSDVIESKEEVKERIDGLSQTIMTFQQTVSNNRLNTTINLDASKKIESAYRSLQELESEKISSLGITNMVKPGDNINISTDERTTINQVRDSKKKLGEAYSTITDTLPPIDIPKEVKEANYLYYDNKLEEAGSIYRKILDKDPNNYDALVNLSYCLILLNDLPEATKILERATRLYPDDPLPWINMAVVYLKLKKTANAFVSLQTAENTKDAVSSPYFHYNYACAYAQAGQRDKALQYLREAIKLGSNKVKHISRQDEDFMILADDDEFRKLLS